MSIKLALLKSGETIISDAKEMVLNEEKTDEVHSYLFQDPYVVTTHSKVLLTEEEKEDPSQYALDVQFTPWIILSKDKKIVVPATWVVTIVDPLSSVEQMYIDKSSSSVKVEEEKNGG